EGLFIRQPPRRCGIGERFPADSDEVVGYCVRPSLHARHGRSRARFPAVDGRERIFTGRAAVHARMGEGGHRVEACRRTADADHQRTAYDLARAAENHCRTFAADGLSGPQFWATIRMIVALFCRVAHERSSAATVTAQGAYPACSAIRRSSSAAAAIRAATSSPARTLCLATVRKSVSDDTSFRVSISDPMSST